MDDVDRNESLIRDGLDTFRSKGSEGSEIPPDGTLGGYMRLHDRPPAFDGPDGYPYTVSMEVEKTPNLKAPFAGYLVFPRWAETGLGITGHVETPILLKRRTRQEAEADLGALTMTEVRVLLDEAVARRTSVEE
jgi:hypothetical protein